MGDGKGDGNSIGDGNGNGNSDGDGNSNGDGNRFGNCDRDGNGDCNGNGPGKVDNDKGRVASSCASKVQLCGRGNTLLPPPWTQRKVHSPALHHGGDTAKSVCSLFKREGS